MSKTRDRIKDKVAVFARQVGGVYVESARGVPYVKCQGGYSACYFGSTKTWNVYLSGIKAAGRLQRDEAIKLLKEVRV